MLMQIHGFTLGGFPWKFISYIPRVNHHLRVLFTGDVAMICG